VAPCGASTENAGYGVVVLDNLVWASRLGGESFTK